MEKSYEQELSDVFKKLYEKRKNAIDVYDALAYWNLFRDASIPCVPQKNHNKFMAGLRASAKKCGLRIYREKICYNNCLISTYLPYIDSVDEIIFPDGKTCSVIRFVLLIPKFVDQGPIIKAKANGTKKELCLTYNNKLAWEDIEKDYEAQFDCCYISAIPGIKHTFLFGENLKLNISELKNYLNQNNRIKQYPVKMNLNFLREYADDSNFHLLLKPLYKAGLLTSNFLKGMKLDAILEFICQKGNAFDIKKTNPKFNFFEKDFSAFMLHLKEYWAKENTTNNRYHIHSAYWGWNFSNNSYRYFPDKSIADLKCVVESLLRNSEPNMLAQEQTEAFSAFCEQYSVEEPFYQYHHNEKFEYGFISNMGKTDIFLFSATLFSFLQRFFRMAEINDEASFILRIDADETDAVFPYVSLWTKLFYGYEEFFLQNVESYLHDRPFVMTDHSDSKNSYQKKLSKLLTLEAFPVIIGDKLQTEFHEKVLPISFDKTITTTVSDKNQLHKNIVYLYYNFINYITERLNGNRETPLPKEFLKQLRKNYRQAKKILANEDEKYSIKIDELSYLLASLFTFRDMLGNENDLMLPMETLIENAISAFGTMLSQPLIREVKEEEICPLFQEFIEHLKLDGRLGNTFVSRNTQKFSDEDRADSLRNELIGWHDSRNEFLLYLDYKNYFAAFQQFAKTKHIRLNFSQGKLQRLYLHKNGIIRAESKAETPKFQCMRVLMSGTPKKAVLCIDRRKMK